MRRKNVCSKCGKDCDRRVSICRPCFNENRKDNRTTKLPCKRCGKLTTNTGLHCRACWRILSSNRDADNPHWSGNTVGYHGVHSWIRRRKPRPELCERCKQKKPNDLANISGKYKRDILDFEWLCRTCHMKEDGRLDELHQRVYPTKKKKIML